MIIFYSVSSLERKANVMEGEKSVHSIQIIGKNLARKKGGLEMTLLPINPDYKINQFPT